VKNDDVSSVAAKDWLILQIGMFMFHQHGISQKHLISQQTDANFKQVVPQTPLAPPLLFSLRHLR